MLFSKEDVGGKETSEVVETSAGDTSTFLEYILPRYICYQIPDVKMIITRIHDIKVFCDK